MGSLKSPKKTSKEPADLNMTEYISSILSPVLSPVRSIFRGREMEDSDNEHQTSENASDEAIESMDIDVTISNQITVIKQTTVPVHKALREKAPKLGDWPASTPPETNDFEVFYNNQCIESPSKNPNPVRQPPLVKKINWDDIPKLSPSQEYYPTIDEKEYNEGNANEHVKVAEVENHPAKQKLSSAGENDTTAELHSPLSRVAVSLTQRRSTNTLLPQFNSPGTANKQRTFWDTPPKFRTTKPKRGCDRSTDKSRASSPIAQKDLDRMDVDNPGDEKVKSTPKTPIDSTQTKPHQTAVLPITPANTLAECSLRGTHRKYDFYESVSFSPLDSEEVRRNEASQNKGATSTGKGKKVPEKMLPDTPIPKRYQNNQDHEEEEEEEELDENDEEFEGEHESDFVDSSPSSGSDGVVSSPPEPLPARKTARRNKVKDGEEEETAFSENDNTSQNDNTQNFDNEEDLEEEAQLPKKRPAARKPRAKPKRSKGYKPDSDDESDEDDSEEFSPQTKKARRKPPKAKPTPKAEDGDKSTEDVTDTLPADDIDSIDVTGQEGGDVSADGESSPNSVEEESVQPPVEETKKRAPAKQRKRKRNSDEAFKPDGVDPDSDSGSSSELNMESGNNSGVDEGQKPKRRKTTNETNELQKELHNLYDDAIVVVTPVVAESEDGKGQPASRDTDDDENEQKARELMDGDDTADKTPKEQTELFSAYRREHILPQAPLHNSDFNMDSFTHPLQTSTPLPPARVPASNISHVRDEESFMMAYELEHPENADPSKDNTVDSFHTAISNSSITDLGEETLNIESEEDEGDGFSYVYKPSAKHQAVLRSYFNPDSTFDALIGLSPLEVKKQHIRIPIGQRITSALHGPDAAIRRELINNLTFPGNVHLVEPGKQYIFRCCLCKELSDVKLRFYHEETTWTDQFCLNCYSHNCCRRCTRYQRDVPVPAHSQNRNPKTDDYEKWLRDAKKADEEVNGHFYTENDEKENVQPSDAALRNAGNTAANGGKSKIDWVDRKKVVHARREKLADYYRDPYWFSEYMKRP